MHPVGKQDACVLLLIGGRRGGVEKRALQNEFNTYKIGNHDLSGTANCQHGRNKT